MRVLDVATTLGVLMVVLKAGDLILRPYQQEWVQDKLETLTLHLHFMKPVDWFATFVTPLATALATIAVSFALGVRLLPAMRKTIDIKINPSLESFASATIMLVTLPSTTFVGRTFTAQWFVIGKLVAERKQPLRDLFIRWARNCFVFLIALSLIVTLFEQCIRIPQPTDYKLTRTDYILALFAGLPQIYWFLQCFLPGLTLLVVMGLLGILHICVLGLREVTWRIVEFQKGAFAALIAIATLICGIADILARATP
jgi:hypothetical protein